MESKTWPFLDLRIQTIPPIADDPCASARDPPEISRSAKHNTPRRGKESTPVLVKNIAVVGVHWGSYRSHEGGWDILNRSFAQIFGWVEDGTLNPLVSKTYGLDDAAQAIRDIAARKARGKLVVAP